MNEQAPKKIWWNSAENKADAYSDYGAGTVSYIRADIVEEMREALKFAWPIIEHERYKWDCSYGKNFDEAKADRARKACEKTKAALAKLEDVT